MKLKSHLIAAFATAILSTTALATTIDFVIANPIPDSSDVSSQLRGTLTNNTLTISNLSQVEVFGWLVPSDQNASIKGVYFFQPDFMEVSLGSSVGTVDFKVANSAEAWSGAKAVAGFTADTGKDENTINVGESLNFNFDVPTAALWGNLTTWADIFAAAYSSSYTGPAFSVAGSIGLHVIREGTNGVSDHYLVLDPEFSVNPVSDGASSILMLGAALMAFFAFRTKFLSR